MFSRSLSSLQGGEGREQRGEKGRERKSWPPGPGRLFTYFALWECGRKCEQVLCQVKGAQSEGPLRSRAFPRG